MGTKLESLPVSSQSQADAHYRGSRHAKKVKSQENKSKAKLPTAGSESGGCSSGPAAVPANGNTIPHTGRFQLPRKLMRLLMFFLNPGVVGSRSAF